MDNCPDADKVIGYMVASAFIGLFMFLVYQSLKYLSRSVRRKEETKKKMSMRDVEFVDLQLELYGEEILMKDSLSGTMRSVRSRNNSEFESSSDEEADV